MALIKRGQYFGWVHINVCMSCLIYQQNWGIPDCILKIADSLIASVLILSDIIDAIWTDEGGKHENFQ